eukprot:scaffold28856_cov58-Phaeocystis_antarctica.AAC.4
MGCGWRGQGLKLQTAFPLTATRGELLRNGPNGWVGCARSRGAAPPPDEPQIGAGFLASPPLRRRVAVEKSRQVSGTDPASDTAPECPRLRHSPSHRHSSRLWHIPGLPLCATSRRSSYLDDRASSSRS